MQMLLKTEKTEDKMYLLFHSWNSPDLQEMQNGMVFHYVFDFKIRQ